MTFVTSLAAHNLRVTRGENMLFAQVSFALNAGEALLVRGANGSGKTSLLRVLAGLLIADAGEISIDGVRALPLDTRLRNAVLYAGHASGIKDDFNALENLREALLLEGQTADVDTCMRALAAVDLLDRRRVLAAKLSQGQRRRIVLAQLHLTKKKCWLLDEPTNALDAAGVALFNTLIADHLQRGGIAVLATHLPIHLPNVREIEMTAVAA